MDKKKIIGFDFNGTLVDDTGTRLLADPGLLQQLAQRHRLGIVTGGTRTEVDAALTESGLFSLFEKELIVTIDDTNLSKASGAPFKLFLERTNAAPVVFIGDSDGDEDGCALVGIPFVRVTHERSTSAAIQGALELLTRLENA